MKAAVLVMRKRDGSLSSVVSESVVPLIEAARQIRVSGEWNGEHIDRGVAVLIDRGNSRVMARFICERQSAEAPAQDKARKRK